MISQRAFYISFLHGKKCNICIYLCTLFKIYFHTFILQTLLPVHLSTLSFSYFFSHFIFSLFVSSFLPSSPFSLTPPLPLSSPLYLAHLLFFLRISFLNISSLLPPHIKCYPSPSRIPLFLPLSQLLISYTSFPPSLSSSSPHLFFHSSCLFVPLSLFPLPSLFLHSSFLSFPPFYHPSGNLF